MRKTLRDRSFFVLGTVARKTKNEVVFLTAVRSKKNELTVYTRTR